MRATSLPRTAAVLVALLLVPSAALSAAGTGTAVLQGANPVRAGLDSMWTVTYRAAEDFANSGGYFEVEIPPRWTAPQTTGPFSPGYVGWSDPSTIDSVVIADRTIRVFLGTPPQKFLAGTVRSVYYGVGGPTSEARADTIAGASTFVVRSQPDGQTGAIAIASSPAAAIVPSFVTHVRVVDGSLLPVGSLGVTADDSVSLRLLGYDRYENPARLVRGTWTVTGGIGNVAPALGTGTVLSFTTSGSGYAIADSGAWADSTGLIVVAHGAYAALRATFAAPAAAGSALAASAEAVDADGNRVTTGPGASAGLRIVAYADSTGSATADPRLVADALGLSAGYWSGGVTARRAGVFWMAARDTTAGIESPRARVAVSPAAPSRLALSPDSLALTAGSPAGVTAVVLDAYGNRAPVASAAPLVLWSDRPAGAFTDGAGTRIFGVTMPAGADSASFRFADAQATAAPGHIRVIDDDGAAPSLGSATAPLSTAPAAPAGTIALAAAPDTLEADGSDSTLVTSGVVRDAYGNAVAAGERFVLSGTGLAPITDEDPAAPGAQLLADSAGRLSGWMRAGTVAGSASAAVASERGSAVGGTDVMLLPGAPSGAIALLAAVDSLAADSVATVAIAAGGLVDAHGNAIGDGEPYTVASTLGAVTGPDADPATPGVQVNAAGGAIAFTLLGGDALGTATVSAVSVRGAAAGSIPLRLVPGDVSAARSLVAAASPVEVGPAGSAITVTLRDAQDHPLAGVPGAETAVAVTGAAASVTALDPATDAAGAIRFLATATTADTGVVAVTARGVPLAAAPEIVFLHGPLDHYVLAGPAGPLVAGAAASLAVAARDAWENPLPDRSGDVLRISVTSGGAQAPDSVLLASGAATVPFTPVLAAPLALSLRDDDARTASYGPVVVAPGAPHRLTIEPPGSATLAAGDSVVVVARVEDAFGNAAPGATVAATVVAGAGSVRQAAATTDATGRADVALLAGATPGALTLRILAPGSAAPDSVRADSFTVTVVPAAAVSVEIAAPAAGAAGAPSTVTLTLRDAFGNVARDATPAVWLRTTTAAPAADNVGWQAGPGAAGSLADSVASDGATYVFAAADSGTAVLLVRDTLVETIRLRASGSGLPVAESGPLAVGPSAPAALALVSGDGQTAVVDRVLPAPLRVRVRDAFGNAVPGAAVAFRVLAGNGSVDAVAGGAEDSTAAADAQGIAACDAARLGTVAGAAGDVFRAGLPGAALPEVLFTASALPDTAAALALVPASLTLAPTAAATVTVTARDAYGNAAPATAVTLHLGTPAAGSLESLGATSGSATAQSGVTDAAGALAVRYRAPSAAPSADTVFARGVSIPAVALRAATAPDTTVALRVLPDAVTWTAGQPVRVLVQAVDAYGNVATADGAVVAMQPSGSVSWAPASGPLAGGEFTTFATDTVAETVLLSAAHARGPVGTGGPVRVDPAAPAGAIPVAAARDTLTADGRSTTSVVLGPVRDAFGNVVPAGTLLLVSAGQDSLLALDARPDLPGLDLATAADGTAGLVLRAATTAGPDTLRVASRAGSAAGSRVFTLLPPPALAVVAGTLAPLEAVPGQAASFTLQVANPGPTPLLLDAPTSLSFGGGAAAFAAPLSAPIAVPAGGSAALPFAPTTVPAALTPGVYAPALRAVGTDGAGEAFDFYPGLGGAQVSAIGLVVSGVGAAPASAPFGHGSLALTFDVHNPSGSSATLVGGSVAFSQGGFLESAPPSPPLPATIPAGTTLRATYTFRVPSGGIAPGAVVTAVLTSTAQFVASTVVAQSAPPVAFPVVSAARLAALPGSAAPSRLLRGRTAGPSVRVRNSGSTAVTLNRGATRLRLDGSGSTLETALPANALVAAGDSATLVFDSLAVGAAAPKGVYAATLLLSGAEAGEAYADSIPLDPPGVAVVDPALLSVAPGSLAPGIVSAGQTRSLAVRLANAGDVDFRLDAATELRLGAPVGDGRALGAAVTVPAGGSVDLVFAAAPVGSAGSPGTAAALLAARGLEDGVERAFALDAGALEARPPSAVVFVAGSTQPRIASAGSTVDLAVEVENLGGSPFLLDPAASRLELSDGVEQVAAPGSGAPVALAPGARVALSFPAAALPGALASQPYAVALTLQGVEWGQVESVLVTSPPGEISVLEPVAAIQARGLDTAAPVQAAPGSFPGAAWGIELTPLAAPGTGVQVTLNEVRVTVLADGAPAASPGALLGSLALRDAAGTLLAQVAPGAANPVALVLPGGRPLGASPESLLLDLSLRPAAPARSIALSIEGAGDVVAVDALTGAGAGLVAPGGLPFAPLRSREITLYAGVHGYPNPFRAGREAVNISYVLEGDAPVSITIYTLLGDVVRELSLPAGAAGGARGLNEVPWDGRNGRGDLVRPGVYVARIEGGGVGAAVKVGVLR
jgi:hypothetical protein